MRLGLLLTLLLVPAALPVPLQAGDPQPDQFFLYFPFYRGNSSEFTGFAITNDSPGEAQLRIEALANGGTLQPYPNNPNMTSLASRKQIARLGSEFFGVTPSTVQDGWVRIGSNVMELASFFQFGNGLSGDISRLDGGVAQATLSNTLYFTRVYDGPASFPSLMGGLPATTTLAIANPSNQAVTVTLRLINNMGQQVGVEVVRQIAANGCLRAGVGTLFGQANVGDGFIRADVSGPGAVGFELIELADTLLGLNASTGNTQNLSYSAQLANGDAGGVPIFTSVKLVNVSNSPQLVTLTAINQQGNVINVAGPFTIQPNNTFQRGVGMIFGLGPATGPPTVGSMRVEATGPGIIGDVVFGDPTNGRYAAALPLQTRLFTRAIFSQVANAVSSNPAFRTFTGLAFHNPGNSSAMITIQVFNAECVLMGATTVTLAAGARRSDVLAALIPATRGQAGGYIEVTSTQPVVAQQLFGNLRLEFLSAVPPTIFE